MDLNLKQEYWIKFCNLNRFRTLWHCTELVHRVEITMCFSIVS